MKKAGIHGRTDLRSVNPEWFTGRTWMKDVSKKTGMAGHDMYHVHFERGSRTKLHMHNGPQILIAIKGAGSIETFKRRGTGGSFGIRRDQRISLGPGDTVYVPKGTLHAHGSTDKKAAFSHIAINVLPGRGRKYGTEWFESDFKTAVTGRIGG